MIFYRIPPDILEPKEEKIPFNLLFKNNHTGKRNLACAKFDQLNAERLVDIEQRCAKGEELVIAETDLEDFKRLFGGEEEILKNNKEQIELRKLQQERIEHYRNQYPDEKGLLPELLRELRLSDDFSPIVKAARMKVESFSLKKSQYLSNLIAFNSFCLSRSGELPAGCAFAYFLSKILEINDEEPILEIMTAYALRELGYSYLKLGKERERDPDYEKYPMFTQHILSLSQVPLSKNISRYILEHRETPNRTGFPRGKGESQTHFNSYIVGACHELFRIFFKELKGKDFNSALAKAGTSHVLHPQVAAAIYSLKR